jgi:hypothetical protein
MAQQPQSVSNPVMCSMAGSEINRSLVKRCGDVILFQRISSGWEYWYISDCETYRGFHREPVLARKRLFRQLGWERQRFESAEFKRF